MACNKENCEKCGAKLGTQFVRVVQDRSGSMLSNWKTTVESFNEYVNGLKADEDADRIRVGLTVFDTTIDTVYKKKKVANAPHLAEDAYPPRGGTALYDAIGKSIQELDKLVDDDDRALMVIMTDGGENSSKGFSRQQIFDMIDKRQKKNWTFVYLGANQDAWAVGASFGVSQGNSYTYTNDHHGKTTSMTSLSTGTTSRLRSRQASTMDFFGDAGVDNTEQLKTEQLKASKRVWTPGDDDEDAEE